MSGRPVVRVGDINTGGGVAILGDFSVKVNGRPVVTISPVLPHFCCGAPGCSIHCAASTIPLSFSVKVGGKPICRFGDFDTCIHTRITGSFDVKAG